MKKKKMKKKTKTKTNWGIIGLICVLVFVILSSYGFVKLFSSLRDPASVAHSPSIDVVDPGEGRTDPVPPDQNREHLQLYQSKVEMIRSKVSKTDAALRSALQQMKLVLMEETSQTVDLEVFSGLSMNVEKRQGMVQILADKRDFDQVRSTLKKAVEQVGSELLHMEEVSAQERVEKISFGFIEDGQEVVTHVLRLTRIPFQVKAKLAFIIDDLGYEKREFEEMMTIPRPMTFAVIPHLPKSVQQARRVWQEGFDLILHQPMEPTSNLNPGDGAIYSRMTTDEVIETLSANLASLPQGLIGVNNHMGSKVTADPRVMEVVLQFFRERKMFFIDSSTAPDSVVATVARQVGTPYAENRIFIDNVDELDQIKEQIMKAARIALRDGEAITIGHVRNYTARAILESIDELESMGIQLVYARELLHSPGTASKGSEKK